MGTRRIKSIIFRYLTSADFFNIYKPSGTEVRGGGQAYIDFPTASVSLKDWGKFFDGAQSVYCDTGEKGPTWEFPIMSIGQESSQGIKVYQRRAQSICIASQRITSQRENRVNAWRPEFGFPEPNDPTGRNEKPDNLLIYIVHTMDDEFWAGWSLNIEPGINTKINDYLSRMLQNNIGEGYAGFMEFNGRIGLNTEDVSHPFID